MNVVNKSTNPNAPGTYIGRGSVYGNPFVIQGVGTAFTTTIPVATREESVRLYAAWLFNDAFQIPGWRKPTENEIMALKGDLICYCAPALCHGEVLRFAYERILAKRFFGRTSNTFPCEICKQPFIVEEDYNCPECPPCNGVRMDRRRYHQYENDLTANIEGLTYR